MLIQLSLAIGLSLAAAYLVYRLVRKLRGARDRRLRAAANQRRDDEAREAARKSAEGRILKEDGAVHLTLGQDLPSLSILWKEPNRAETPTLHIGQSGERYSTLTGAWWLDKDRLVVNHRSGLAVAVFSGADGRRLATADLPHMTDDIAAKPVGSDRFEIAVSGCWDALYSLLSLEFDADGNPVFDLIRTETHVGRDFAHGVAYSSGGELCYTVHTGEDPRIAIGDRISRLPRPWGARDVCHDPERARHLAIAVSANPGRKAYSGPLTSVWEMPENGGAWRMIAALEDIHSDALATYGDEIWLPDQHGDRILAIAADGTKVLHVLHGGGLDFPHGTAISPSGQLAVTNYGSSSVTLVDLSDVREASSRKAGPEARSDGARPEVPA